MPNMKDCNCCMEDIYQVMLKIAVLNQYIYDIIIFSGCMWVEGRFQCAPPPIIKPSSCTYLVRYTTASTSLCHNHCHHTLFSIL